jgi:diguanylate cyclase (GGDEF)-like protein
MATLPPKSLRSSRILFADDDMVVRNGFARALRAQGFIVDLAADGLEALALAREYPYALVATDHEMPGLSGLDLVVQLRQLQPDANYALVTGRPDAVREAAKIPGLSAVIKKPWTDSDLMKLVANAVREAYQRQTSRQALTRPEMPAAGSFVLLLESDDAHAASMLELLEHSANERYRVVRARNLSEACGYLKTRDYEVILSGLDLPDAHGLPTVTELHAVSPGTPILVVMGSEDKDLALAAVQAGAQDYLVRANVDGSGVGRAIRYAVERKRIEKRLSELAHFDQLTQLANRSLLNERLARALARSSRTGRRAALLLIDLDHFKAVNDTYGHGVGDRLLIEVAHRVLGSTRSEDTVARIGGDEFAVLLEELEDVDGARRVAQRILNAFATNLVMDGRVLPVTASVGIAIYPDHATNVGDLMRLADAALYQAKDSGKNAYCVAGQDGCDRVSRRAELERELLGALDAGRFSLALQPLCRVADRSVCGHEAFLRWDAADGRQVNAREFLAVLDETGDILRVGRWVLDQACVLAARWRARRGRISVNISPRELGGAGFVDAVQNALRSHDLPGNALELELSEQTFSKNIGDAKSKLPLLAAIGVSIAVDDFGVGRSSLTELADLPISTLKLHPSLVKNLSSRRQATLSAMLAAANTLGWSVVAKSVETEEQLEFLRRAGCSQAQGLLFGAPEPALPELGQVGGSPGRERTGSQLEGS